jgi:hypothetical protein
MKVRYDMSHVDLATDNPDTVALPGIPDWLEPDVRALLRRMDYANKKNAMVVNMGSFDINLTFPDGEEWKCDMDLGSGEIVKVIE